MVLVCVVYVLVWLMASSTECCVSLSAGWIAELGESKLITHIVSYSFCMLHDCIIAWWGLHQSKHPGGPMCHMHEMCPQPIKCPLAYFVKCAHSVQYIPQYVVWWVSACKLKNQSWSVSAQPGRLPGRLLYYKYVNFSLYYMKLVAGAQSHPIKCGGVACHCCVSSSVGGEGTEATSRVYWTRWREERADEKYRPEGHQDEVGRSKICK